MTIGDELAQLGELHQRGVLSDEEFARATARVIGGAGRAAAPEGSGVAAINALRRSRTDRWIGGVCGGLAEATGMAAWIWRLIFAVLLLCAGSGVLVYLLLWIFVPLEAPRLTNGGASGEFRPG
jgi:phage shock protein PspC (stress-responsive transcriptional regulator)